MYLPRRRFMIHSIAGAAVLSCRATSHAHEEGSAAVTRGPEPHNAAAHGSASDPSRPPSAAPTCERTAPNIEGPFFRPNAPLAARGAASDPAALVLGRKGDNATPLRLVGQITDLQCRPLPGAMLEVWHADGEGAYDHTGFQYRGRVLVGQDARFDLRTIVPGRYRAGQDVRPAHVHIKVHAQGRPSLTTQLYFQNDPYNAADPFIHRSLIMPITHAEGRAEAAFDIAI